MLKFLGRMYLRSIVIASVNRARHKPLQRLFEEIFKLLREIDGESNDTTIYSFAHQKFVEASRSQLRQVCETVRPK